MFGLNSAVEHQQQLLERTKESVLIGKMEFILTGICYGM